MQTSAKGTYSGMLHCAGGILKNEGPLAFYKVSINIHVLHFLPLFSSHDRHDEGTVPPLLGIGLCVSIQFGALEWSKRIFAQQNLMHGTGGEGGRTLSSDQLYLAGIFAGVANSAVSGPVEHIRISQASSFSLA
jgi:solute carrier family 25 (mitochondrial carnitine/acylcarnitine transporter), member 20/29